MMEKFKEALSFAASICSTSEQCAADVLRKTDKFGLSIEEKDMLVQKLKQDGFLDEKRYVRAYVNDRFKFSKWGKMKITYMLKQKGIDARIVENALEMIDQDDYTGTLLDLLKQKRKSIISSGITDLKAKLYRFALSRGFEPTVTVKCLKKMKLCEDEGNSAEY